MADCFGWCSPGVPIVSVTLTSSSQKHPDQNMTVDFTVTYQGLAKEAHTEDKSEEEIRPINFHTDALLSTSGNWLYLLNANNMW